MKIKIDEGQNRAVAAYSVGSFYRYKFCKICNEFKPPRAHHCSMCERCVFRMDHHCPWVGNCVGLMNHKKFLLFLIYAFLGLQSTGWGVLFTGGKKEFQGTMYAGFFISLSVGILMGVHLFLVLCNWTTLEAPSFMSENNIFES